MADELVQSIMNKGQQRNYIANRAGRRTPRQPANTVAE